jgi:hypothetical protein
MMHESSFRFAHFLARPQLRETPADIAQKFLDTLDTLSAIDPLFTSWKVLDFATRTEISLSVGRSRIVSIVEDGVARNDDDQPEPKSGYTAIGVTDNPLASRVAKFTADAGAAYPRGIVQLEIGDPLAPTDPSIVKYQLFRQALLAMTVRWQPAWSYTCAFRMYYWKAPIVPGAPMIRYNPFHIPWIAYLSPALSTGFVVPATEVRIEHAPGGGLLLSATEENFDPTNPEHLRRAGALAEIMMARTGDRADDDNPP